jgi:thioredoxin 1
MSREHEQFISDKELKQIREKKLKELIKSKEKTQTMSTKPAHITDKDFDKTIQQHPLALIDFWAEWCGPCRALAPTIEELATEYAGKVFIGKLNIDENPKTAECFQVFSIPTMIIFKNGKEVDRMVGLCKKNYVEDTLKKYAGQ